MTSSLHQLYYCNRYHFDMVEQTKAFYYFSFIHTNRKNLTYFEILYIIKDTIYLINKRPSPLVHLTIFQEYLCAIRPLNKYLLSHTIKL